MLEKAVTKFNIVMSCLLLVLTVVMFVGVTLAYFSDRMQTQSTFTSGNVKITLSEAAVKRNAAGDLVEDTSKPRIFGAPGETVINDYGKVYPGQSVLKDPTITNTGSEAEWIAAKVVLSDGSGDLTKVMGYENSDMIDIEMLLSGGLLDERIHVGTWNGIAHVCYNDRYAMIQIPNAQTGEFAFYFLMLEPVPVGGSVLLFDQISFPMEWTNEELRELADLKIHIQAFGVQTFQLDSCFTAMTEAFPDHFDFN